jgi:hypothetical protein
MAGKYSSTDIDKDSFLEMEWALREDAKKLEALTGRIHDERVLNAPLEAAKHRVSLVERIMKLPYIKAIRNAALGQERFVCRDDVITAIHEYAKVSASLDCLRSEPPSLLQTTGQAQARQKKEKP